VLALGLVMVQEMESGLALGPVLGLVLGLALVLELELGLVQKSYHTCCKEQDNLAQLCLAILAHRAPHKRSALHRDQLSPRIRADWYIL
jgi:hypothetical protein